MTCSNVISTFTNSRYLYRGPSRFRQSFVCGKCSGCISKQRTDWRVRTYYEARGCLSRSSSAFVLFDTLTYCDDHIKKYSDLYPDLNIPGLLDKPCFSRADVQKFFKRLRISLKRDGYRYDPDQLRYILTSEYGHSEETNGFRNTHRPHYHLLFFVTFPIDPIQFSRYVARAWHLGKTDGVRPYDKCSECPLLKYCKGYYCLYQTPEYVENERVLRRCSSKNCMKAVNYVTKYISKDLYMSDKLQSDVDLLWGNLYPDYQVDHLLYRRYRSFCGQVLPFHLQSQGFGLDLLADQDERSYILATGQVHLPTSDKSVIRSVALPRYYQRKLFYKFEKIDGKVKWSLTNFGVDYKVDHLDDKIKSFMREYRKFDDTFSSSRLFDLALYKVVYKGTMSDYQSLMLPYKQYYRRLISPHHQLERPLYYNFCTKRDKLTIGSFLSTRYVVTPDGEIVFKGKQLHKEFIPYDGYVVVDDKVCSYWNGYDRKLAHFDRWRRGICLSNDAVMYQVDVNQDYFKQLGLLPST